MAILIIVLLFMVVSFVYAIPVYFLWNWLMPHLFNLPHIDFYETMGLVLLISLLLGVKRTGTKNGGE